MRDEIAKDVLKFKSRLIEMGYIIFGDMAILIGTGLTN
jgi:hypothetical protein